MATQPLPFLTPEQYLEIERKAEFRSEYIAGAMFAMSGGTRWHSLIATNCLIQLGNQLRGRSCEVHGSDMRVLARKAGLYTYPDITIVCGAPELLEVRDTLLNPTVIIEVLSISTEAYDRGRKFEYYRTIDSLQQYLLLAQDRIQVDLFTRQDGGQWVLKSFSLLENSILLESIGCSLSLAECYEKVEFPS